MLRVKAGTSKVWKCGFRKTNMLFVTRAHDCYRQPMVSYALRLMVTPHTSLTYLRCRPGQKGSRASGPAVISNFGVADYGPPICTPIEVVCKAAECETVNYPFPLVALTTDNEPCICKILWLMTVSQGPIHRNRPRNELGPFLCVFSYRRQCRFLWMHPTEAGSNCRGYCLRRKHAVDVPGPAPVVTLLSSDECDVDGWPRNPDSSRRQTAWGRRCLGLTGVWEAVYKGPDAINSPVGCPDV